MSCHVNILPLAASAVLLPAASADPWILLARLRAVSRTIIPR